MYGQTYYKVSLSYHQQPKEDKPAARYKPRQKTFYCPNHDFLWERTDQRTTKNGRSALYVMAWTRKTMAFLGFPHSKCPECRGQHVVTLIDKDEI